MDAPSKKRKLESTTDAATWDRVQTFSDISFSIPVRKKLKLEVGLQPGEGFRGKSGDEVEIAASWRSVRNVFCLPVPEKAAAQCNFCFMTEDSQRKSEHILWTVPEAVPKDGLVSPSPSAGLENSTYRTIFCSIINAALKKHGVSITEPSENEFASQISQAHRKSEKAYHVKAFRGSKDGFLFFLSTGIFWGFKKPLEFFSFDAIDSVSYTSVLQRTFNLNVVTRLSDNSTSATTDTQELEFSMVDQADFAGIDEYVKRHRLQDASMAEQRRAKKLNINGVKAGGGDAEQGGDEDGGDEGELAKAAREAQDLQGEDEEEEDDDENFDPGSEGESEGEGSASDDDEDGDGDENGDPMEGGDDEDDEEGDEEDDL